MLENLCTVLALALAPFCAVKHRAGVCVKSEGQHLKILFFPAELADVICAGVVKMM